MAKIRAGERVDHFETLRLRKDGRPVMVAVSVSPVLSAGGAIVGASSVARDLSETKGELGRHAARGHRELLGGRHRQQEP
jgi:PAS domain S-box-containing protein